MDKEWLELAVSVLAGLATAIPLVIKLVEYVKKLYKEKQWSKMLELVLKYMAVAEEKFSDGATRKEWVMAMVKAAADSINYSVDEQVLSEMIDNLCAMSKVVNVPVADATPAE